MLLNLGTKLCVASNKLDDFIYIAEMPAHKLTTFVSFIHIVHSYTDPVDGSKTSNQGLILNFQLSSGDPARVVFRLSGTGSAGATVRMYLEQYEKDTSKHDISAPVALKDLAEEALRLVQMEKTTGRDAPTVIT